VERLFFQCKSFTRNRFVELNALITNFNLVNKPMPIFLPSHAHALFGNPMQRICSETNKTNKNKGENQ